MFIPSPETQAWFFGSNRNNYTISFDSGYIDKKVVNHELEFQIDIGSAQNINSPKYLIIAHPTADRYGIPKKLII